MGNLSIDAQIALVEKRMELRRERIVLGLARTKAEVKQRASRFSSWLPFAGAAGALAVGFFAVRHRWRPAPAPVATASRYRAPPAVATRSIVAKAIALGAAAVRFATSTEAKMLLNAFRTARARGARAQR